MKRFKFFYRTGLVVGLLTMAVFSQARGQQLSPPMHDPCIIQQDSTYYIFATGWGIVRWSSTDLLHWKRLKPVFDTPPAWTAEEVRGFRGVFWAPDISYYKGTYYLYYAVSAFGKNTSCIGLATNRTLDDKSPLYHWVDRGKIIQSVPGRDMWNAIDPNLVMDSAGTPWLDFGSFWGGIKLVRLNSARTGISDPPRWYTIAERERTFGLADSVAGNAAIEGPYIFRRGPYYYLFVSYDYCCRGIHSNYKMMVGRSRDVRGPYLDRDGVPMIRGGATLVLKGDKDWPGVGHNAILETGGKDYLVFHGYDASDHGRSKLRILPLRWQDGWPVVDQLSK